MVPVCALQCEPAGMAACPLSVGCAVLRRCVAVVTYTATRAAAFTQVRSGSPAVRVCVYEDVTCGGMIHVCAGFNGWKEKYEEAQCDQ